MHFGVDSAGRLRLVNAQSQPCDQYGRLTRPRGVEDKSTLSDATLRWRPGLGIFGLASGGRMPSQPLQPQASAVHLHRSEHLRHLHRRLQCRCVRARPPRRLQCSSVRRRAPHNGPSSQSHRPPSFYRPGSGGLSRHTQDSHRRNQRERRSQCSSHRRSQCSSHRR